jgi:aspartyl/asparaginyl-tRNA synthetase
VSRVHDPITDELQTVEAPADVIAGYVQAAKDYLMKEESANEKVAHDMDVVLKFLHARGTKGIRPEERDNILKRIKRWKVHLSAYAET